MLGIGGGIIYVLLFSHYLPLTGIPSHLIVSAIVANSMFAIFFAGISGSYKHYKNKNFHPKQFLIIGSAASIASIFFSQLIINGNWYTKEKFTYFFILLLLFIAFRILKNKKADQVLLNEKSSTKGFILTGLFSGTIAAFSGVGGGVLIVPILTDIMKIPIKKATAISLGVISIMAFFTSVYAMVFSKVSIQITAPHFGLIVYSLALPVAAGSLLFSPFGVQLAAKLSPSKLRLLFAGFLLLVIAKMIIEII
jgi:uncharacterized membrane protein YfcA